MRRKKFKLVVDNFVLKYINFYKTNELLFIKVIFKINSNINIDTTQF